MLHLRPSPPSLSELSAAKGRLAQALRFYAPPLVYYLVSECQRLCTVLVGCNSPAREAEARREEARHSVIEYLVP